MKVRIIVEDDQGTVELTLKEVADSAPIQYDGSVAFVEWDVEYAIKDAVSDRRRKDGRAAE